MRNSNRVQPFPNGKATNCSLPIVVECTIGLSGCLILLVQIYPPHI